MSLPNAIASHIRGMKARVVFYPTVSSVSFYVDTMTIDSFNSLVLFHISMLREQYRYSENEHEDWVSSHHKHSEYIVVDEAERKIKKKELKETRLLDSWALKMPMSPVPSDEELKEEFEWRAGHRLQLCELQPKVNSVEELEEAYFTAVCLDLKTHGTLLSQWEFCGRPRDQAEAATKAGLPFLVQKAKQQTFNKLAANSTLEKLASWQAPIFMLERAFGRVCYEEKVLSQIRAAIQLYR